MNRQQIERLRRKNNIILQLAFENGIDYDTHISDSIDSPTFQDLSICLFPEWEIEIDKAIKFLETHCFKHTDIKQDPLVKIQHPEGRTGKTTDERNKAIDILTSKNKSCNTWS